MKALKIYLLLFPIICLSQSKFNFVKERLVLKKKYEYVYDFQNNYAVFRTFDKKMGVIDSTGNVFIQPTFSFIYNRSELKNLFEVGNRVNRKFKRGYIDLKGNIRIPIDYDNVYYHQEGLIGVSKAGKHGVLDTLNNLVLPLKYDYLFFDGNLIIAETGGAKSLYNYQGKQITDLQFLKISRFKDGKAIVTDANKSNFIIDNQANIVLKPIKDCAFEAILKDDLFLIKDNLSAKFGVVTVKAQFLIPVKFDKLEQTEDVFIATRDGKKGIISRTDSVIKPFIYDHIYPSFREKFSIDGDNKKSSHYTVVKDNLCGIVDLHLEQDVLPMRYKWISTALNSYYIVVNTEDKNGLFLVNGEKLLDEDYQFFNVFENSIFATKNKRPIIVKLDGQKFEELEILADDLVAFTETPHFVTNANQIFSANGKFGIVNYQNKIVVPCEYDFIENIYLSNEFIVKKGKKFGIVNSENKVLLEIEYDAFVIKKEVIEFRKQKLKKYYEVKQGLFNN
ncbi:WG repeat-containing protein [Flavobacterium aurantiibacter]|uniref:WG repeat-containing protein n=1 Tax=Flavobacterium aurantiibacter TaxID=2023067 RepID=A0A255ZAK2_9FLAO|nr:WG repeat-containing protein [Flavobacterium aurantiibacter]OYQ38441.1 hypothetical protein CHX27_14885 [Flavobacterium aurantiibacter]